MYISILAKPNTYTTLLPVQLRTCTTIYVQLKTRTTQYVYNSKRVQLKIRVQLKTCATHAIASSSRTVWSGQAYSGGHGDATFRLRRPRRRSIGAPGHRPLDGALQPASRNLCSLLRRKLSTDVMSAGVTCKRGRSRVRWGEQR